MGNGGSPPAHLPLTSLSNPEVWLQIKWSQPPPRAPSWLFAHYQAYNPPPDVGSPLPWEEWRQEDERRCRQLLDEQADHARHQEAARLQQLLDEQAARARQEAAAARAHQEAACRQQLLDE
jgi:hypothetical protein